MFWGWYSFGSGRRGGGCFFLPLLFICGAFFMADNFRAGWAVPLVLPISRAWQAFDDNGQVRDPQLSEQLRKLGQEMVRASQQFAVTGACEYSTPVPTRIE